MVTPTGFDVVSIPYAALLKSLPIIVVLVAVELTLMQTLPPENKLSSILLALPPQTSIVITYSVAPTMIRIRL